MAVTRVMVLAAVAGLAMCAGAARGAENQPLPNFLWITSEDNGPHLGCYGEPLARTPNLDALAAEGCRYLTVWSNASVCAPARTAIITGVRFTSLGAEHMRSLVPMPAEMRMLPQLLREAGYYCTNNSKEDYNVEKPEGVWDESSPTAHWRNRPPGRPFFAVFNHMCTHESQIRSRPYPAKTDPAEVRLPAFHPDTPEVRQDWGQYHDRIAEMDALAGRNLEELRADGLAGDTIVFYFADNGPGLARCKRSGYDSGLRVPLIVYLPPRLRHLAAADWRAGGASRRPIEFVDLAPTVLSLAGMRPPAWMMGRAFLGPHAAPPGEYIFGARARIDERYDLVRSVRNDRYIYIRNFMPHRPLGQHSAYMFETPTTRVWKRLFDEGSLDERRSAFWKPRPPEELYDLHEDPDEVNNLAGSPGHRAVLERMRSVLREHILACRDTGFLPEDELHRRSAGSTPWEMARDDARYPLARILAMAELAAGTDPEAAGVLEAAMQSDPDNAVRWWGAIGLLIRGRSACQKAFATLRLALEDPSPAVRSVAAEALGLYGDAAAAASAIETLLDLSDVSRHGPYVAMFALNALDELGPRAAGARDRIAALPTDAPSVIPRIESAIPCLIEAVLRDLRPSPSTTRTAPQ